MSHIDPNDPTHAATNEQPDVKQLIKYKQHIRLENDRRLHREHLANVAQQEREKEKTLLQDVTKMPIEIPQEGEKIITDHSLGKAVSGAGNIKQILGSFSTSKQEEEILKDENIFQPRRHRDRLRNRRSTSRSGSPTAHRQFIGDLTKTIRNNLSTSAPMIQFGVCRVCGNILDNNKDQSKRYDQQVSAAPSHQQPSSHSDESRSTDVDDWFESASQVSSSREVVPWEPDEHSVVPTATNPFQQMYFQPINNDKNILRGRSPNAPIIVTDEGTDISKSRTPRMSESDVFVRTPSPTRRSSFSRNLRSPPTDNRQSNRLTVNNQQPSNKPHENFFS